MIKLLDKNIIHSTKIAHLSKDVKRPLWSVIIPTYNCAYYLKETLTSVLMQDPGEDQMEIIVVDDHSTQDDPEAVVKEVGKGRVQFIRQKQNVGKVRNYETGLNASKGYYIHQLHGDDVVRPEFYKTMASLFELYPQAGAAYCRTIYIDAQSRWTGITGMIQEVEGVVPDIAAKLYTEQHIQTPSMVVKREVYEQIGAFDRRLDCMEDWEMWMRIATRYPIAVSNKVLAEYRIHDDNTTNLTFMDGSALDTHRLVFNIVDGYISEIIKIKFSKIRKKKQAKFLLMNYKKYRSKLSLKEKSKFAKVFLTLDPSIINILRFLK